jgi:hypothetical protein
MIFDLEFLEVGKSDYLIFRDNKNERQLINTFYYKSGAFAALACTFSILDMHCENIRVMNYSPYPIDMEVSLTNEVKQIRDTDLLTGDGTGNLGGIDGVFKEEDVKYWIIKKSTPEERFIGGWAIKPFRPPEYKQNRLWSVSSSGIKTVIPVDDDVLLEGFQIGMTILSECEKHRDFDSWFARIQNVAVRYLVAGTAKLAKLRDDCFIYGLIHEIAETKELIPRLEKLLGNEYDAQFKIYNEVPSPGLPSPSQRQANPDFIYPKLAQTKMDFLNLDIPVFYHRIGTCEIVDSVGNQVTLPGKSNFPRSTFFANVPTEHNVKQKQVSILQGEGLSNRRLAIAKSILETTPQRKRNDAGAIERLFRPIK